MSNLSTRGEHNVRESFEKIGLEVKSIKVGEEKTPDFEVYRDGKLVFFCEEKTLENDNDFEGVKHDPTYSSISTHVHKAAKQFRSTNPNHEYPNVLVFNNSDSLKNIHDLFITLTGHAILDDGELMKIHRVGRVSNDIDDIDLYIWIDMEGEEHYIWGELHQQHDILLKQIFGKNV